MENQGNNRNKALTIQGRGSPPARFWFQGQNYKQNFNHGRKHQQKQKGRGKARRGAQKDRRARPLRDLPPFRTGKTEPRRVCREARRVPTGSREPDIGRAGQTWPRIRRFKGISRTK